MKGYIVCDEFDYSKTFANRTDAVKECKRWRLEGRNAEIVRRVPDALADRPAAIIPRFYPPARSLDQEAAHLEPVAPRWYERSLDDWDAPIYLQPELPSLQDALALSPEEMWREHKGWSA